MKPHRPKTTQPSVRPSPLPYAALRAARAHPVLPPHDLYQTADELFGSIKPYARVELGEVSPANAGEGHPSSFILHPSAAATQPLPPLAVERRANDPLHLLKSFAASFEGRILLLAETPGRRETMLDYFAGHGITPARSAG